MDNYKEKFKQLKCCVIIPTYNNSTTIKSVIDDVVKYCDDVFVVLDGCTDNTPQIVAQCNGITTIGYKKNRGKGYALRYAFDYAVKAGFDYAITIDSDGQHYASDLPIFLQELEKSNNVLLIGSRQLQQENVPGKSTFGNKFSSFWFRVETGICLPDTQSGYRLYPIAQLSQLHFFTNRFEFEIEVIVRAAWHGIDVHCVPVDVYYPKREERVSHFRPFKDFTRISILNTILVTLGFIFYRPRMIMRSFRKKTFRQILNEDILDSSATPASIAVAIGFGVFMGIVPIWGYQLIIGFIIAHLLKINKMIFFLAANISLPPMIPLILYISYVCGSYALGEGSWTVNCELTIPAIKENILQYIIGAVIFATIAGLAFGTVSYFFLLLFKKIRHK